MTTEDLENYIPKGELEGFPKEIIARMLDYQEEQGYPRDISVFEANRTAGVTNKGFYWSKTKEKSFFWEEVINRRNFDLFFGRYPKQNNKDNSQQFIVGDKVIDIAIREIGFVKNINLNEVSSCQLEVAFEEGTTKLYSLEGKYYNNNKIPFLLHYREDYNYDVIDFNNLPKRQEPKRWRAEVGQRYYYIDMYFKVHTFIEENSNTDTKLYDLGNYFQTEKEAQEVADKLNKYFQELINSNK